MRRRRKSTAVLLLLPLGLAACSSSGPTAPSIGMKRASVDLSFTDTSIPLSKAAVAPILNQLLTQGPGSSIVPPETTILPQPPPVVLQPKCPAYNAFAVHSAKPLAKGVTSPIAPGTYPVFNKGTIALAAPTGGAAAYKQTFPMMTTMQVSHVNLKPQPANPNDNVAGHDLPTSFFPQPPYYGGTFDVKEDLGNGSYTLTTYELTKDNLNLIKRVTHIAKTILTPETTDTFTPSQPLKIMAMNGNPELGSNWADAQVDASTGEIGVIRGDIPISRVVNVCGKPVYAYVVMLSERFVKIGASGTVFVSQTNDNVVNSDTQPPPADPNNITSCWQPGKCDPMGKRNLRNAYLVANQYGALFVGKITHMTTIVPPLAITIDNEATLSSITPKK
jgi:hypothetical protein